MAIATDAFSTSTEQTAVTSYSFTHITGSGLSNSVLCVIELARGGTVANTDCNITGITYNSVALTKAVSLNDLDVTANTIAAEIWYLKNPSSGSNSVTITFSGTCHTSYAYGITLTGVDQTSPIDATNSSTATAQASPDTTSITTVAASAWVIDGIYNKIGTSLTRGGSQNLTGAEFFVRSAPSNTGNGSGDTVDSSYKGPLSAGATSMSWTFTGSDDYVQVVTSLKPFVAPTGAPSMMMMGVGM